MPPRLPRRTRWLALLLVLAGVVAGASAGATSETFNAAAGVLCPMAHCNPHLDGQEGLTSGTTVDVPVSTPPSSYATYTPATPLSFGIGLACAAGIGTGSLPNTVECTGAVAGTDTPVATPTDTPCSGSCSPTATPLPTGTPVPGPFVVNLQASGSGSSATLTKNWTSAAFVSAPSAACTAGSEWAMDGKVVQGAPLFSDLGYSYLSDDQSFVKYNAAGDSSHIGTCAWGQLNPVSAAMVSWNAIKLPPNGTGATPYPGGWWVVGQGTRGPVLAVDTPDGTVIGSLALPDSSGGHYVTFNTVSTVAITDSSGALLGARLYDSTADCATPPPPCASLSLSQVPGRLYAIDVLPPSTATGTPTLQVAWSYDVEGPSGASPMVMPAEDQGTGYQSPVGDQIYFDGSGASCGSSCTSEDPTLFALKDNCPWDTMCSTSHLPTPVFAAIDFTTITPSQYQESGLCPDGHGGQRYEGIQSAPVLEGPEATGTDPHYSVWVHVACGPWLYRFDAQTGALWAGSGVGHGGSPSIDIGTISLDGQTGYVPGSTMQTVTDADLFMGGRLDQVAFLGVNKSPASLKSYVLALDLETGNLLWDVQGPEPPQNADSPFHGQFPIAKTSCGSGCTSYMLIAATAGSVDGATILGIPLK